MQLQAPSAIQVRCCEASLAPISEHEDKKFGPWLVDSMVWSGGGGMVGFTLNFAVGLQPDGHCPSEKPSPFPLKPHLGGLHWQEAHGKSFQGEIFKIGTEK